MLTRYVAVGITLLNHEYTYAKILNTLSSIFLCQKNAIKHNIVVDYSDM